MRRRAPTFLLAAALVGACGEQGQQEEAPEGAPMSADGGASDAMPVPVRTRHVSPAGDDAGPGTTERPFRTLQRAAKDLAPGDVVIVHAGTYRGFTLDGATGTREAPIVWRAESGVVVTEPGPLPAFVPYNSALGRKEWPRWPFGITVQRSAYVVLEGFEVRGMPAAEADGRGGMIHRGGAGIRLEVCRHVTVRRNRAHDNGRWGIYAEFCDDLLVEANEASGSKAEHGVYIANSSDRPTVRHNVMRANRGAGLQINADNNYDSAEYARFARVDGVTSGATIEENTIIGNGAGGAAGINLDGVSESVIRANVLTDNHATGVALYQIDGFTGSQGNRLTENRIEMAADARWGILIAGCPPEEIQGSRCVSASRPVLGPRPDAAVTGSTGNILRGNRVVTRSATAGSIRIDARSLPGLDSDDNEVTDRLAIDAQVISLAEWQRRTGQDRRSQIASAP